MAKVWIIEDDEIMTECLVRAIQSRLPKKENYSHLTHQIKTFPNALTAIRHLNEELPDLILLDVVLTGPDGFSFLHELVSYYDTANIPVILVTSLGLATHKLQHYNVVDVLQKETMTPAEIKFTVERTLLHAH